MSYGDLPTKSSGDVFGLSEYQIIKDNFDAGMPDIIAAKGDLGVGTGPDAIARLAVGADGSVIVADSTTATGLAYQIMPAALVQRLSAFDPAVGSWVVMPFDVDVIDTNGVHSTVTNTSRLTIPSGGDGLYKLGANIGFETNGLAGESGHYGFRFLQNGLAFGWEVDEAEMSGRDLWKSLEHLVLANVGDYFEVEVLTTRHINILASSRFWINYLRRKP